MVSETVLCTRSGMVALITLNRPERRNAINAEMGSALRDMLASLDVDSGIRAIVLTGAGTAFCAGVDQNDTSGADRHVLHRLDAAVSAPIAALATPIIAAVNGPAVGGGLELALTCDLVVGGESASFGLPEVRIGSMPGSGGTQRLVRAVPRAVAMRMLLTGERIDAAEAFRIGLISDLFPTGDLLAGATTLAERVAANAPLSVRAIRDSVREGADASLDFALACERTKWALLSTTADRAEGRRAFLEKRAPIFTGQ